MARFLVASPDPGRGRNIENIITNRSDDLAQVVTSAEELSAALAGAEFDFLLLSARMPGPGWHAIMRAARESHPRCLRALLTPTPELDEVGTAFEKGEIHRYLREPFQVEELEELVVELTNLRKLLVALDGQAVRDDLGRRFREALDRRQLRLVHQPIFRTSDLSIYGTEFLLRSSHPELPGPPSVIHAAEMSGMILEFGAMINQLAAEWASRVPQDVNLFVNVHGRQLSDPSIIERFAALLPHAGRVVLELTESFHLAELPGWDGAVRALRERGFRLAVDDFGAGYNGLQVLVELEPAIVKADASLIRGIHLDGRRRGLLSLLVKIADVIGAKLVAEGVETEAEYDAVVNCGVELVQGYFLARPAESWPVLPFRRG